MNFKRGIEPKEALEIGWRQVLKEMRGEIFDEKDIYQNINHQFYTIGDIQI